MSKAAFVAECTLTCVHEIGTLVRVNLGACLTFLAITNASKCLTVWGSRRYANMSKVTGVVGAMAMLEMLASGRVVRGRFVGKCTESFFGAIVLVEPAPAQCLLRGIVAIRASSARAKSCLCIRVCHILVRGRKVV
jgi:hypothetical protein